MACNGDEYYLEHLEVIDSTNSYARNNAARLWSIAGDVQAVVVLAENQTAGRGQRGNKWQSRAGENLLASIMVRPKALPIVSQFALSQAIALAVRAAMSYIGIDALLKWPNDIYVGERKLAGILVELDCCGALVEQAVIGVGLNVNQEQFVLMDKVPVSMKMLTGEAHDVNEVLGVLLDSFLYYYSLLEKGDYRLLAAEYKRNLLGFGKTGHYRDAESCFYASIIDVESDGRLLLRCAGGTERLYSFKEVEFIF